MLTQRLQGEQELGTVQDPRNKKDQGDEQSGLKPIFLLKGLSLVLTTTSPGSAVRVLGRIPLVPPKAGLRNLITDKVRTGDNTQYLVNLQGDVRWPF